jgi:hypothetical protein
MNADSSTPSSPIPFSHRMMGEGVWFPSPNISWERGEG